MKPAVLALRSLPRNAVTRALLRKEAARALLETGQAASFAAAVHRVPRREGRRPVSLAEAVE